MKVLNIWEEGEYLNKEEFNENTSITESNNTQNRSLDNNPTRQDNQGKELKTILQNPPKSYKAIVFKSSFNLQKGSSTLSQIGV